MTLTELFEVVKDKDIYEMYVWANWFFRSGRVSCVECIRTRAMMSQKQPNCAKCGLPSARLIKRTFGQLVDEADMLQSDDEQEVENG